jgi:hypothetical protein
MNIDQAWHQHALTAVDHQRCLRDWLRCHADPGDQAVFDQNGGAVTDRSAGPVENARACQPQSARA